MNKKVETPPAKPKPKPMNMKKKVETPAEKPKFNPNSYQFPFLNKLIKAKVPATFVFANGAKRKVDAIIGYDQFCLVVKEGELETLLFKHDIRSVTPVEPLSKEREVLSLKK